MILAQVKLIVARIKTFLTCVKINFGQNYCQKQQNSTRNTFNNINILLKLNNISFVSFRIVKISFNATKISFYASTTPKSNTDFLICTLAQKRFLLQLLLSLKCIIMLHYSTKNYHIVSAQLAWLPNSSSLRWTPVISAL